MIQKNPKKRVNRALIRRIARKHRKSLRLLAKR